MKKLLDVLTDNALLIRVGLGVLLASGIIAMMKRLGLFYQMFHKADPNCTRHGGELVAEVLKAHGCKYIFCLTGGHISPILVGAEKVGIRMVDTRHEVNAVFAADAVARLSGTVGVACVTAGPGLTNTVTAVKNAQMADSPVLLLGGASPTPLKGRGSLQEIDQMVLFKPMCKYCAEIKSLRDIVPVLREAIRVAQSGTPGPVFVEFPIDTLYTYQMVKQEIGIEDSKGGGIGQKVVQWYLNNQLNNLFAGAFEPRDMSPLPVQLSRATTSQVQKSAEMISRAKKPLILLGSQATLPPTSVEDLKKALEEMGIPCFLSGMSRGMLGRNSPLQIRQKRKEALREADVVILAGTVCDFRLSYGRVLSRRSKIIAVNRSHEQLYKNSDIFWKPNIAIEGDVGSFVVSLQRTLKGYKADPEWARNLKSRDEKTEKETEVKSKKMTEYHVNPLKVLHHLEELMDEDSIIVADGGDFVSSAAYILRPRSPLSWLDPGAFGTLGAGGGFALGAKLVRPESEVWIVYGDGSLGYSVAEFDTFTRHKIPVIALVGNDACWTLILRQQVPLLGSNVACGLEYTNYHVVADGYGAKGFKLDRDNEEEMDEVIKDAQRLAKDGTSVLINCLIGKTDFREGSLAV